MIASANGVATFVTVAACRPSYILKSLCNDTLVDSELNNCDNKLYSDTKQFFLYCIKFEKYGSLYFILWVGFAKNLLNSRCILGCCLCRTYVMSE